MSGPGHFRALARHAVRLTGVLAGDDGRWQRPAQLVDLGLGGARLVVDREDVGVGAPVRLSVNSPDRWDPLEIDAKVVWARERHEKVELGVSFEKPTNHTMRALMELLGQNTYS
jgi:hypothetical protein